MLCAGSELTMSFEDTLLAGAIVHTLETRPSAEGRGTSLNDQAPIAKAAWVAVQSDLQAGVSLADLLRPSLVPGPDPNQNWTLTWSCSA